MIVSERASAGTFARGYRPFLERPSVISAPMPITPRPTGPRAIDKAVAAVVYATNGSVTPIAPAAEDIAVDIATYVPKPPANMIPLAAVAAAVTAAAVPLKRGRLPEKSCTRRPSFVRANNEAKIHRRFALRRRAGGWRLPEEHESSRLPLIATGSAANLQTAMMFAGHSVLLGPNPRARTAGGIVSSEGAQQSSGPRYR